MTFTQPSHNGPEPFKHREKSHPLINMISFVTLAFASATAPRGAYLPLVVTSGLAICATYTRGGGVSAVLKKSLVVLPFILMAVAFTPFMGLTALDGYYEIGPVRLSKPGFESALNAALKSWTAALCVLALASTTGLTRILEGLSKLRFPSSFVVSIAFANRYAVTLSGDAARMRTAMTCRMYDGRWLWRAGALGGLIGALFLRSLDRAERVHQAAVSRGFDGSFHGAPFASPGVSDYIFLAASLAVAAMPRMAL